MGAKGISMENKVVVHMRDGSVHKGITNDFRHDSETFHLLPAEGGGVPLRVVLKSMKALFYVKDYIGNRDYQSRKAFEMVRREGRRAVVTFEDGETIWGIVPTYDPNASGFDFYPADPDDNNTRIFVVNSSIRSVEFRS
jgi:hypothetical protein